MTRILLGGLAGGIVVFLWSTFSHLVLPLGEMGLRVLPNEDEVISALRQSVPESGLYLFPAADISGKPTPEQQHVWEQKYTAGPVGLLVYRAAGADVISPRQLLTELASNVGAALVVAWVMSLVAASYFRRVLGAAMFGAFAWLSISASYWNWYGFPTAYIAVEGMDQFVGWGLAGLAIAAISKKTPPQAVFA